MASCAVDKFVLPRGFRVNTGEPMSSESTCVASVSVGAGCVGKLCKYFTFPNILQ